MSLPFSLVDHAWEHTPVDFHFIPGEWHSQSIAILMPDYFYAQKSFFTEIPTQNMSSKVQILTPIWARRLERRRRVSQPYRVFSTGDDCAPGARNPGHFTSAKRRGMAWRRQKCRTAYLLFLGQILHYKNRRVTCSEGFHHPTKNR